MIHTLFVSPETTFEGLKKDFRKKLMTGGAIVRLLEGLEGEDLRIICERFLPESKRHSLAAMVLEQVALNKKLPFDLKTTLLKTDLPEVKEALS